MKPNFILSKSNCNTFIQRLKSIVAVTGCAEMQSFYTGSRSRARILEKAGIKHTPDNVTETQVCYIVGSSMQVDLYPSGDAAGSGTGIIIRTNSDSCNVIYFGQKIKFTPNRIYLIGYRIGNYKEYGSLGTIRAGGDLEEGMSDNEIMEQYSSAYYDDYYENLHKHQDIFLNQ